MLSHEELVILNDIRWYLRAFCKGIGMEDSQLPPLAKRGKDKAKPVDEDAQFTIQLFQLIK